MLVIFLSFVINFSLISLLYECKPEVKPDKDQNQPLYPSAPVRVKAHLIIRQLLNVWFAMGFGLPSVQSVVVIMPSRKQPAACGYWICCSLNTIIFDKITKCYLDVKGFLCR